MAQEDTLALTDTLTVLDSLKPATPAKEDYYQHGLTYYGDDKFAAAAHMLDTCLMLDSTFNQARLLRGKCYEKNGDLERAIADYEYLTAHYTYRDLLERRIKFLCISVILSKYWYYMIAMMLVVILLMAAAVKSIAYKRGY
jgi:tetratricopeptide (TPR) repeat protein